VSSFVSHHVAGLGKVGGVVTVVAACRGKQAAGPRKVDFELPAGERQPGAADIGTDS
jgi:hypothetical protein